MYYIFIFLEVELRGRRINSFVIFDFDHLLVMERSSELIKIRLLPTPNCPLQNQPTNSFLVIYRNLSKGPVLQKLQELRIQELNEIQIHYLRYFLRTLINVKIK